MNRAPGTKIPQNLTSEQEHTINTSPLASSRREQQLPIQAKIIYFTLLPIDLPKDPGRKKVTAIPGAC